MARYAGSERLALTLAFFAFAVLLTFIDPGGSEPEANAPADPAQTPLDSGIAARFAAEPVVSLYVVAEGQTHWLALEEYIMGVVGAETVAGWEVETLAAQAVLARTFTVQRLLGARNPCRERYGTDTCSDPTLMQAYRAEAVDDAIRTAVERTRGLILIYDGQPAHAFYSSCAGPQTAAVEEAFPGLAEQAPYLEPVESHCLELAPDYARAWSLTLAKGELAAAAGTPAGSVRVTEHGPSGRPVLVQIGGQEIHVADLRRRLGFDRFRSTYLTQIEDQGERVRFAGLGWGHGLGLDQWGAEYLARSGSDFEELLAHYFPKARLARLWQAPPAP